MKYHVGCAAMLFGHNGTCKWNCGICDIFCSSEALNFTKAAAQLRVASCLSRQVQDLERKSVWTFETQSARVTLTRRKLFLEEVANC